MTLKRQTLNTPATPSAPVVPDRVTEMMQVISQFSERELQDIRHKIDELLCLDLGSLNLAEELALQFRQGQALQNIVNNDPLTPANQKAQIFNSIRSQLADIIKQQESVWSMERLKKIEVALVKVAGMFSDEQRAIFFDLYGAYLKDTDVPAA